MSGPPYYYHLSMRLSEILDDIGVNERIVSKRRSSWLLMETMMNFEFQKTLPNASMFIFGSQSEGSTTLDLGSDLDVLCGFHREHIITNIGSDRQLLPDKIHLMMVQDETTSPGYCLLQLLRCDGTLVKNFQLEHFTLDCRGRILMKHSRALFFLREVLSPEFGRKMNGPALAEQGKPFQLDNDVVFALFCSSWPKEAEPWLQQQNKSDWPTTDMKRDAAEHGCFVVPVASRESPNQDTEWRISTSFAERCLMLNINMTQLRCYILMKMILKTYVRPLCEDAISSFMCKNVLFQCIADSSASEWSDSKLIARLQQCLHLLCNYILDENCPHFIIPRNNRLAGKLSTPVKEQLVEIMCNLTGNIEQSLLGISIDQLGHRLHVKSGGIILAGHLKSPELIAGRVIAILNLSIVAELMYLEPSQAKHRLPTDNLPSPELITGEVDSSLVINISEFQNQTQKTIYNDYCGSFYQSLMQNISTLCQMYTAGSTKKQLACLFTPLLCANLGSIAASMGIYNSKTISKLALVWFSAGLSSYRSYSMLKLASALYCVERYEDCRTVLAELKNILTSIPVLTFCSCRPYDLTLAEEFVSICNEKNEEYVIKQNVAFCVTFLQCEIYCVPKELRYDFFRSTEEDRAYRPKHQHYFDWAVVDSLPYLHLMEYKVYTQLHRPVERHRAVDNLVRTINTEPNLGHRETALNLLGQCMEQEQRLNAALCCYMMSLNERRRNNAANWHVCRLFARLLRLRERDDH